MSGLFRNDRVMAGILIAGTFFIFLGYTAERVAEGGVLGWTIGISNMAAAVLVIRSIWRDRA